jgi:hypothetical protein
VNQLTLIASLPSGAGCKAALPPEAVKAKDPADSLARHGYQVNDKGLIERIFPYDERS